MWNTEARRIEPKTEVCMKRIPKRDRSEAGRRRVGDRTDGRTDVRWSAHGMKGKQRFAIKAGSRSGYCRHEESVYGLGTGTVTGMGMGMGDEMGTQERVL